MMMGALIIATGPPLRRDITAVPGVDSNSLSICLHYTKIRTLADMDKEVRQVGTRNAAETESIGEEMGRRLSGGEVIELSGDVGAGKTTFVRGLARGIGSPDRVSSPTFTIYKTYESEGITLYHYDFYRVEDVEVAAHEMADIAAQPKTSVVVEWSDAVKDVLPANRIKVRIRPTGEDTRIIEIS